MDAITPINVLVAFAAGTLSFLSPCMLPLVPGYLAVLGAGSTADTAQPGAPATQRAALVARRLRGASAFIAGFTVIFVALGVGAGFAGGALVQARRPIELVGGIVIALLGLAMVSERLMPSILQGRVGRQLRSPEAGFVGAFGFGVVFGAAWSPCIGPTLGAILTLAAAGGSAVSGGILLAVFAAGLGVPFLLLAAGAGWLEQSLTVAKRHMRAIRIGSGVLLIAFGVLLATGWVGRLSSRLSGIPGLDI